MRIYNHPAAPPLMGGCSMAGPCKARANYMCAHAAVWGLRGSSSTCDYTHLYRPPAQMWVQWGQMWVA